MKESKKKRWFFIDTNIFLRTFVKENETSFSDCLEFLNLISSGKIQAFISTVVLIEVNFVLLSFYKFEKNRVCQALQSMIDLPRLKIIDDFDTRTGIELYTKLKVKFIDCLLASFLLRKKNEVVIVSYDHDFDKLGIKRLEPKEILTDNS